jgi:hypothetical protein
LEGIIMASRVAYHTQLLERVSESLDIWTLTSPAGPAAMLLIGQPTEIDPIGYMAVASKQKQMLTAGIALAQLLSGDAVTPDLIPGWEGPVAAGFAFNYREPRVMAVVGWSFGGLTAGEVIASGHPEVPCKIELASMYAPAPALTKQQFSAHLLAVLADSTRTEIQ